MSHSKKDQLASLDGSALDAAARKHQFVSEITFTLVSGANEGVAIRAAKSASVHVHRAHSMGGDTKKLRVSFDNPQAIEVARSIGLTIEDSITDALLAETKRKAAEAASNDPAKVKPAPVGGSSQTQRYSNRPTGSRSHGAD